ncbi:unnamed protein product [Merluccius merluccius]
MDNEQRSQERIALPEEEKGREERRKEGGKEEKEGGEGRFPSNQPQDSQSSQSPDPAPPPGVTDSPGELPQCMLGNRKVDNMSFMISCTNWY